MYIRTYIRPDDEEMGQLPGSAYMRCVVRWTCDHCCQDFYLDPDSVDIKPRWPQLQRPECGHMGAAVTLSEDEPPLKTTVRSDSGLRDLVIDKPDSGPESSECARRAVHESRQISAPTRASCREDSAFKPFSRRRLQPEFMTSSSRYDRGPPVKWLRPSAQNGSSDGATCEQCAAAAQTHMSRLDASATAVQSKGSMYRKRANG